MGDPASSIQVSVILLKATVLCHLLLGVQEFVGLSESGVQSGVWVSKRVMGCGDQLVDLNWIYCYLPRWVREL